MNLVASKLICEIFMKMSWYNPKESLGYGNVWGVWANAAQCSPKCRVSGNTIKSRWCPRQVHQDPFPPNVCTNKSILILFWVNLAAHHTRDDDLGLAHNKNTLSSGIRFLRSTKKTPMISVGNPPYLGAKKIRDNVAISKSLSHSPKWFYSALWRGARARKKIGYSSMTMRGGCSSKTFLPFEVCSIIPYSLHWRHSLWWLCFCTRWGCHHHCDEHPSISPPRRTQPLFTKATQWYNRKSSRNHAGFCTKPKPSRQLEAAWFHSQHPLLYWWVSLETILRTYDPKCD